MEETQVLVEEMAVRLQTFIAVPPDRVWHFLGTVEGFQAWLGPKEYEPRLHGKILFVVSEGEDMYRMTGEVTRFDPPRELAFTWREQKEGGAPWPVPTLVTIRLVPADEGTVVQLTHSGFERLPEAIAAREYAGYVRGWERRPAMARLQELVADTAR